MANRISTEDKLITKDCITINVNGSVNGNKVNKGQISRWDGTLEQDGFVYTSSTRKNEDGSFSYKFSGINMGENILGNEAYRGDNDAVFKLAGYYRDKNYNEKNEGVINYVDASVDNKTIRGTITETSKFRYNEGNALQNNEIPHPSVDGENTLPDLAINGGYSTEQSSFFDINAYNWVDELKNVRNL